MSNENTFPFAIKPTKASLKKFPFIVSVKRYIWNIFDGGTTSTALGVKEAFPLFTPFCTGRRRDKAQLTIQAVNQTNPFLSSPASSVGSTKISVTNLQDFPKTNEDLDAALEFKKYLDGYGSDKANLHDYHNLYGPILKKRDGIKEIFEIGIGTLNTEVVSNMGPHGKPGASLRAFRDFLGNAHKFTVLTLTKEFYLRRIVLRHSLSTRLSQPPS